MKNIEKCIAIVLFVLPFLGWGQIYAVDPTFNLGNTGFTGANIACMVQQSDGKILCSGFVNYNGVFRNGIIRLNADGTLDNSFDPGSGPVLPSSQGIVTDIAVDSNGKIVVVGEFNSFRGVARNCIARLNVDGTLDNSFNPGNILTVYGSSRRAYCVKIDQDGKILVGGCFRVTGTSQYSLLRLNQDGTLDTNFTPNYAFDNFGYVKDIELQSNNKILTAIVNSGSPAIMRFNTNGITDSSFATLPFQIGGLKILVDSDDKIYLGGILTSDVDISQGHMLMKLNSDGTIDTGFSVFPINSGSASNNSIQDIKLFSNKILIGGNLNFYDQIVNNRIGLLNLNGTSDNGFSTGSGPNSTVYDIEITNDNKVLISGTFSSVNGINVNRIARLADVNLSSSDFNGNELTLFSDNGSYFLQSTNVEIKSIELYDVTGKKLHKSININNLSWTIENSFAKGLVVFRVEFSDDTSKTIKIIN